jgi:hypothetical protein
MITFDPAKHEYSVDGAVRRSVTQIISDAGLIDDAWFTETSRLRGQAVHVACHYFDERDLESGWMETSPHAGYVLAWEKFKAESGFVPDLIEQRMYNPVLGYCGTLDRTGKIGQASILLDIKTSATRQDWHAVQLAGYAGFFPKPLVFRRFTVHLRSDWTYKVEEQHSSTYMDSWQDFLAAMRISEIKHGRKRGSSSRTSSASTAA